MCCTCRTDKVFVGDEGVVEEGERNGESAI